MTTAHDIAGNMGTGTMTIGTERAEQDMTGITMVIMARSTMTIGAEIVRHQRMSADEQKGDACASPFLRLNTSICVDVVVTWLRRRRYLSLPMRPGQRQGAR